MGDEFITGFLNGDPFSVRYTPERYAQMMALVAKQSDIKTLEDAKALSEEFAPMTQESYSEFLATKSPYLWTNPATNKVHLKFGNALSTHSLPKVFVDKVLKSVEKGIVIDPLIKAWARFLRNPHYSEAKGKLLAGYVDQVYVEKSLQTKLQNEQGLSNEVAQAAATVHQTAITQEGLLCTYKVSQEITKKFVKDEDADEGVKEKERYDYEVDEFSGLKKYKEPEFVEERVFEPAVQGKGGDPFLCYTVAQGKTGAYKGHIIKVGHIHELEDWSMVNTNDNSSCVKGMHCGNLDYIRSYQHAGTITHYIFVDPMDIGAIVQDNTGALRVRRYYVYKSFAGVNKGIYHSSDFAKLTDMEYAKLVEEAVNKSKTNLEKLMREENQKLEAAKGLVTV